MSIINRAYILGDNVSTDQIHPPHYFSLDRTHMKKGFLRGISSDWAPQMTPGSVIIAGRNLGIGSSRELTAQVFKEHGVALVLAESFARIFYRNLTNIGVSACHLTSPNPWQPGTVITVEFDQGARTIITPEHTVHYLPPSPFIEKIVAAGGLLAAIDTLFSEQDGK